MSWLHQKSNLKTKEPWLSIQKIQWILTGTLYPLTVPFYTKVKKAFSAQSIPS